MFKGPNHSLRPACTAVSRSCGLYKILGARIWHSIAQDSGEETALKHVCISIKINVDFDKLVHENMSSGFSQNQSLS